MFIDSHCHLDCIKLDDYNNRFDSLIESCQSAGVSEMLCVSINMNDYPHMRSLVAPYPEIYVSVGEHPMADQSDETDYELLKTYASDERVIAIGETGLDYYYHKGDPQWQKERFAKHLELAKDVDKPVIIHTRDAGDDTLNILHEGNVTDYGGVIHCFTETIDFARKAMDLGMMISFSGIVTFKNADALREVAKIVPDDLLLIETDSPYLAPVPHRGKQNTPAYVSHVAETLAKVRNTSIEHIAETTRDNFYRLFRLNG